MYVIFLVEWHVRFVSTNKVDMCPSFKLWVL
jgi:hypothetical protein